MPDRNIVVEELDGKTAEDQRVELVERKGTGHPDSLADGISEAVSRALSKEYREEFGTIAHHNTDEVQIIGGESGPGFGGGKVTEPIYILLGGRATQEYDGDEVNVDGVAVEAARNYLEEAVRNLDVEEDVIIDSRIRRGSSDLTEMYERGEETLANDTSFGVGHAPFSETEKTVFEVERELNSEETLEKMPFLGEDVKVMGNREGDELRLTVAAAFVDRHVEDVDDYMEKKERVEKLAREVARRHFDDRLEVDVNTADGEEEGELYLTVTGTSAEMGDDGSTGRGNRVSGLITPKRSMSLEASSGKNPVAHIGKLYNVMSHKIAEDIVERTGVEQVHVSMLSQIGTPLDDPQVVNVQVSRDATEQDREEARRVADEWLDSTDDLTDEIVSGKISTF